LQSTRRAEVNRPIETVVLGFVSHIYLVTAREQIPNDFEKRDSEARYIRPAVAFLATAGFRYAKVLRGG
jgi:hypothetical protein